MTFRSVDREGGGHAVTDGAHTVASGGHTLVVGRHTMAGRGHTAAGGGTQWLLKGSRMWAVLAEIAMWLWAVVAHVLRTLNGTEREREREAARRKTEQWAKVERKRTVGDGGEKTGATGGSGMENGATRDGEKRMRIQRYREMILGGENDGK